MSFLNRVGNLLKNTVSKHASSELSSPSQDFQAIRSMSTTPKIFVGGLSYNTDETSLHEEFSKYGEVIDAKVIADRESGRSRGFAFITYASTEAASSAIQACDGQDLHGRRIRVNYATEKPRDGVFGGGGYGGGGGGGYGGYGGGNQYPSAGAGGYGGGNQFTSGGFGGGDNYTPTGGIGTNSFSGSQSGFSSPNEATRAFGDPIESDLHGNGDLEGNNKGESDFNDEPNDFANRSG